MNLTYLRYFAELAHTHHYTRADNNPFRLEQVLLICTDTRIGLDQLAHLRFNFEPEQIALILYPLKDRFKVRDTGKYRGYETDCTDPCFIYLLHSSDTTLNA